MFAAKLPKEDAMADDGTGRIKVTHLMMKLEHLLIMRRFGESKITLVLILMRASTVNFIPEMLTLFCTLTYGRTLSDTLFISTRDEMLPL